VIGSTGFVGRATAAHLRERGRTVIGTSTTGEGADLACDIRDPRAVDRAITGADPGSIVLVAGLASIPGSWEDPDAAFRVNTGGAFNVLDGMRRLAPGAHLLVASSAGVYGPPASSGDMPYTEDMPMRAVSPYAASKAATEVLCRQFAAQRGLGIAVCRIFNQVGPGQNAAQAPAEFSQEIVRAERRGDRVLRLRVGNPAIERDFTDVRDSARAFGELIDAGATGTFNVCSGTGTSLAKIVEILASNTAVEVEIVTDPDRSPQGDILRVYGSNDRLREAIGWRPEVPLERSLADLLDDWRSRE